VVVLGGGRHSSMVALDLRGQMLAVVDGSDGDSSPFSQVGVVPPCLQAINGVCGHWLCFFEGQIFVMKKRTLQTFVIEKCGHYKVCSLKKRTLQTFVV
jgi:hypothetical protein